MTIDALARLSAANPVSAPPAVESAERLRRLIDDERPSEVASGQPDRRRRVAPRVLSVSLLAVGVAAVVALLATGSSGPGVNIAAGAYAATSPGSGIVEAEFVVRSYHEGRLVATLRQREWVDAATDQRRELVRIDGAPAGRRTSGAPRGVRPVHAVQDRVEAPGLIENWTSGSEAHMIHRMRTSGDLQISGAIEGIRLDGVEGIKLYRRLYREGAMRLVGRERVGGRLLWKLESHLPPALAREIHTRLIVLVDPKTFLPVREIEHPVAEVGSSEHGPRRWLRLGRVESDLVVYRHIPAGKAATELFDLAAQHPGARVVTSPGIAGRFRSLHPRRAHKPDGETP